MGIYTIIYKYKCYKWVNLKLYHQIIDSPLQLLQFKRPKLSYKIWLLNFASLDVKQLLIAVSATYLVRSEVVRCNLSS